MSVARMAEPTDKFVGNRVRMRRLMLGMTQAELASGLGLTFQQVQKYEKGVNRIGASRLQHMSEILGVPVPFFFEGAPRPRGQPRTQGAAPLPTFVSDLLATSEGHALIRAYVKIAEPNIRRSILRVVESIADAGAA